MNIVQKETVENIISGIELPVHQNIGVQKCLLNNKMCLAFDTGMGKTFTYAVFVRGLLNRNPDKKHILIIINTSIQQITEDVRELVNVPTYSFTGQFADARKLMSYWNKSSIIIMTYECFQKSELCLFLQERLNEIESITLDEAHHVSNWYGSDEAFMIRALCRYPDYVVELTATPVTSKSSQYYQLMNLIDRDLSHRRGETDLSKYNIRYYPVNREDYNLKGDYKTTLELVTPQINQIGEIDGIISLVVKGEGAYNQVNALINIIKDRLSKNKNIIVYINYHNTRKWVEKFLIDNDLDFVSLHGKITNRKERKIITDRFVAGEVNILLTSVSESLNLDADVVIFYEFTTKIKQVMGRAHRGLNRKNLELVFILTKDTMEIDYFIKYIYKRSMMIQNLLGKDYSEIIQIGKKVQDLNLLDG